MIITYCMDCRHTLQEPHALRLVLPHRALDQSPSIVELCLCRYMRLRKLFLVLEAQNLRVRIVSEIRAPPHEDTEARTSSSS